MEYPQVAISIKERIDLLAKCRLEIKARGQAKANTIADYDLALGQAIRRLSDAGEKATIIEKLAKAECAEARRQMEQADVEYKNLLCCIEAVKAELNGYQSIFRHMDDA